MAEGSLAEVYQRQMRLSEAEPYRREVAAESPRAFGEEDPYTLDAVLKLGQLLYWDERLPEAELYMQRALSGMVHALGENDQLTLRAKGIFGMLRMSQGRWSEAEALFRQAHRDIGAAVGDDNRETLYWSLRLGALLRLQGRFTEAEPYIRDALEGFGHVLGEAHRDTLYAEREMALLREDQKRPDEAESQFAELYREVLRLPLSQADAGEFIASYGVFLVRRSHYADAETPLRQAYVRLEQAHRQRHQRFRETAAALADVFDHTNRPDQAEKWRAQLATLRAATQPATRSK